jgi:hypothetical protein
MSIQNRVEAINKLRSIENTIVPLLQTYCREHAPFKQKNDGQLFKKDYDKLKEIINSIPRANFLTIYVDQSFFTAIYLTFAIRYEYNSDSWAYINHEIYLADKTGDIIDYNLYQPKPLLTIDEVLQAQKDIEEMNITISELQGNVLRLKSAMELY